MDPSPSSCAFAQGLFVLLFWASTQYHFFFLFLIPARSTVRESVLPHFSVLNLFNGCESWTIKKAEHQRFDAFELWCWRRLSTVPWTARRSNQPILKEISPEYSLEGLMLQLKLQCFGHQMEELTYWKRPWCWERLKVGGDGDDRRWDGWMALLAQWTWVW